MPHLISLMFLVDLIKNGWVKFTQGLKSRTIPKAAEKLYMAVNDII